MLEARGSTTTNLAGSSATSSPSTMKKTITPWESISFKWKQKIVSGLRRELTNVIGTEEFKKKFNNYKNHKFNKVKERNY